MSCAATKRIVAQLSPISRLCRSIDVTHPSDVGFSRPETMAACIESVTMHMVLPANGFGGERRNRAVCGFVRSTARVRRATASPAKYAGHALPYP